jgi:hypothetical protein
MALKAALIEMPSSKTPWAVRIERENGSVVMVQCSTENGALAVKRALEEHGEKILVADW